LVESRADCATHVHPCEEAKKHRPDQVKAVLAQSDQASYPQAIYFSRALVPFGEGEIWGHIGIYAWRRQALLDFAQTPRSPLEKREQLEQLRALEHKMVIVAAQIDEPPLSVDSPADLAYARKVMA